MKKTPKIKKRSVIDDVQAKSKEDMFVKYKNAKNLMELKAHYYNI